MSNRSERRAAARGERLRRPALGTALEQRILSAARAWLRTDGDVPDDLPLERPEFDKAMDMTAPRLAGILGDRLSGFKADLFREAASCLDIAFDGGKVPFVTQTSLFFVPVWGPESQIRELLADRDRFTALTGSLRKDGVADPTSSVHLARGTIDPVGMALALPGAVRRAAIELRGPLLRPNVTEAELQGCQMRALDMLGGQVNALDPEAPIEEILVVSRCLVGVRTILVTQDRDVPFDYLTTCSPYLPEWQAGPVFEQEKRDDFDKGIEWAERTSAGALLFSPPMAWADATLRMGLDRLQGLLSLERALTEIPESRIPEAVHVHHGDEAVLVAIQDGTTYLGPVDVPNALIAADAEGFADYIATMAAEVVVHDTEPSIQALRGTRM